MGYLRDIRRLTVALSRARLGLYVLGRRDVFEACYELRDAFALLLRRPDRLVLVTGELWPSERPVLQPDEEGGAKAAENGEQTGVGDAAGATPALGEAVMEGVEHLGQYVFEMTSTRIKQLRAERGLPEEAPVIEAPPRTGEEENGYQAMEDGVDEDEDAEEAVRAEGFEAEEQD